MPSGPSNSDNRYRALYEASQASLTDMSLRHGEALAKLMRFRQGVIAIIQQHFPRAFADAEKLAGKRLIEYEDEIILAYLGTFLEMRAEEIRQTPSTPTPATPPSTSMPEHLQDLFQPTPPEVEPPPPVAPSFPTSTSVSQDIEKNEYQQETNAFGDFGEINDVSEEDRDASDTLPAPSLDNLSLDAFDEDDVFAPPSPPLRPTIRPELHQIAKPSSTSKKAQAREESQKPIRTVALPPQSTAHLDVPLPQLPNNIQFSPSQIEQLGALLQTPKPIFISDVAEILTSRDLAKAWQEGQYRAQTKPYVFLPAPKEYLTLGDLVLPDSYAKSAPKEYQRSPWAQMMGSYRGHRLYMLGVFFQKYLRNILSHKISESSLTLRLNDPRGSVTALILTEDRLDAKALRELDALIKERLSLLVVLTLTPKGSDDSFTILRSTALKENWSPPFPVVISTIKEYVETGSAAVVLTPGG